MTAPTTHWSTTGQLHTGTVAGCEACGKVPTRPATAPRSDAGPESVSLSHRADDNAAEVGL